MCVMGTGILIALFVFLFILSQVQTIGDACMVLSGAPVEVPNHAELITDYGFSIVEAIGKILDPSTQKPLEIRVGK